MGRRSGVPVPARGRPEPARGDLRGRAGADVGAEPRGPADGRRLRLPPRRCLLDRRGAAQEGLLSEPFVANRLTLDLANVAHVSADVVRAVLDLASPAPDTPKISNLQGQPQVRAAMRESALDGEMQATRDVFDNLRSDLRNMTRTILITNALMAFTVAAIAFGAGLLI